MDPLVITISHSLGKDEVVRRLKPALGQAERTFPVLKVEKEDWMGDRMEFRVRALGQAIAGNIEVAEKAVRLEITLPWMLARFASMAIKTIETTGRKLLTKS